MQLPIFPFTRRGRVEAYLFGALSRSDAHYRLYPASYYDIFSSSERMALHPTPLVDLTDCWPPTPIRFTRAARKPPKNLRHSEDAFSCLGSALLVQTWASVVKLKSVVGQQYSDGDSVS